MTFFRSIALLTGVCFCVFFAYALGHGLSTHHSRPVLIGGGLLLAGAAILSALSRDRVRW